MKRLLVTCGRHTLRAVSRLFSTPPFAILKGILDELSDQNAYRRYLLAHGTEHTPTAWREFQDEHWRAKSRRGRCC
jgi:hypothetical protein